jgi:hypothetical protein
MTEKKELKGFGTTAPVSFQVQLMMIGPGFYPHPLIQHSFSFFHLGRSIKDLTSHHLFLQYLLFSYPIQSTSSKIQQYRL